MYYVSANGCICKQENTLPLIYNNVYIFIEES